MAPDLEESKYTRVEYERRFLVSPGAEWRTLVEPYSKTYEDKYLRGTRLRLRVLTDSDSGRRVLKLNKKHESISPYFRMVSRILLSPGEYEMVDTLDGDRIKKTRYYHRSLGRVFSIDVFDGELAGLVICETEAGDQTELMLAKPPAYTKLEVTADPFFDGGNLCRVTAVDLRRKLATLDY